MPTQDGKPATRKPKRRQRDNNGHTKPANEAQQKFADEYLKITGKGRITNAALAAYPNQTRPAAGVTGTRLLKHPKVSRIIRKRLERAALRASMTREEAIGLVTEMTDVSLFDLVDSEGQLDIKRAKRLGLDHLISEIDITERHSKDGSMRRTIKYKIHNKLNAIDLLSELRGWKKEPGKNPADAARETFRIMRSKEKYADLSDADLAKYPAEYYQVEVSEILATEK